MSEIGGHQGAASVCVVVPTRDRPTELDRLMAALAGQSPEGAFAVIVVDDSDTGSAVVPTDGAPDLTVLRTGGRGPAAARNAGAAAATADVLLFTDDDTVPDPGWVRAVAEHFRDHPDHVGAEGPTVSPPYDRLFAHSVANDRSGAFLTCNVAYLRTAFLAAGGFFEGFPYAHCEDLDLGFRVAQRGVVGFAPAMRMVHPPRTISLAASVRRGRMCESEVLLRRRHPERFEGYERVPLAARPVVENVRQNIRLLRSGELQVRRSPSRLGRWAVITGGQAVLAATSCLRAVQRGD